MPVHTVDGTLPLSFCQIIPEEILLSVLSDETLNHNLFGAGGKGTYFAVLIFYHHANATNASVFSNCLS